MDSVQKALETQVKNIQAKTGKSLAELAAMAKASGLSRHGEIRDMFQKELGLGHGDANTLTHVVLKPAGEPDAEGGDVLAEIYVGPKAALRPIHEKLMAGLRGWGEFEVAPKKGYVSLRRKKQFAMVGPATKTQVELGLNIKDLAGGERLVAQAAGGMCQYKVRLSSEAEVDGELMAWVRAAFEAAG